MEVPNLFKLFKLSTLKSILAAHIHADMFDSAVAPFCFDIDNAFVNAATLGDLDEVKYLCSIGADIQMAGGTAFSEAASFGHTHMMDYLMSIGTNIHDNEDAALMYAVLSCQKNAAAYLISLGLALDISHPCIINNINSNLKFENIKRCLIDINIKTEILETLENQWRRKKDWMRIVDTIGPIQLLQQLQV